MSAYLVRTRGDLQLPGLFVEAKPAPAGALHRHRGGTQPRLHGLEAAEVSADGLRQRTLGWLGPARTQVLPEDGVVEVAAAIELDGALEADHGGHVANGHGLGELLLGHVEVTDVGGVVLAVVQLHDLGADDRLQRVVIVPEIFLVGTRLQQRYHNYEQILREVGQSVLAADTIDHGGQP